MKNPTELIPIIEATFSFREPTTVKTKPCRIKYGGKFVTLISGKSIWRNIGFAKSALLNHFCCISGNSVREKPEPCNPCLTNDEAKPIIRRLIKLGVIEFVESPIESFAESKRS